MVYTKEEIKRMLRSGEMSIEIAIEYSYEIGRMDGINRCSIDVLNIIKKSESK